MDGVYVCSVSGACSVEGTGRTSSMSCQRLVSGCAASCASFASKTRRKPHRSSVNGSVRSRKRVTVTHASIDDEDADEYEDDEEFLAGRLAAVVNTYEDAALSASGARVSTYVRDKLSELSEEGRMMFLDRLSSSGIENAWVIAGEGYELTRRERSTFVDGEVDFHVVNEILGDDEGEESDEAMKTPVYVFEGKVSKLRGSFLNRFAKAFYVDEDDDPLRSAPTRRFLGRAPAKKGPLEALLPLYFASNDFNDDAVYVPGTRERADLMLDYRDVPVAPSALPKDARAGGVSWPAPRLALYPFDTLVDYLRPLGPGVLVGKGYRLKTDPERVSEIPSEFLSFVLVRRPSA